jgi:2-polyprenyl-3-methyl-5-hydroxy-6-metoxy-1,4-benzoquinol methylase
MPIFKTTPHPTFPEYYDICSDTGVCFYKHAESREYSSTYFMEEFKNQYKKTYYEDETNLRNLAKKRLNILKNYIKPEGKSILEIGCAAGFFLSEAESMGFEVKGIELSQTESDYALQILKLNVKNCSLFDYQDSNMYDVLAAFFVIEHIPDQEKVFDKIFSLLKPGGFLFLGIPSLFGPTFQTNPNEWFATHPKDHFVDYSISSLKLLLKKYKAEIVYQAPMSYHPSRDLGWRGKYPIKLMYKVLANLTCYGDTIQVLAKK